MREIRHVKHLNRAKLAKATAWERCDFSHQEYFCGYVIAAVAIVGIGMTAYGMATAPGAPPVQTPPPPPNSTVYDENGGILSRQVFDAGKNEWITYGPNSEPPRPSSEWALKLTGDYEKDRKDPGIKAEIERRYNEHVAGDPAGVAKHAIGWRREEYGNMFRDAPTMQEQAKTDLADYQTKYDAWTADKAARDADKAKLAGLRTEALGNLNELSPERQAQIENFGTAYADSMHRDLDPRYAKTVHNEEEQANARGMFGSRAYVDTKAELGQIKANQDTDIANQASMAKETLTSNDRQYWANLLNQIDSGQRADSITASQINKSNSDIASQNYAGTLGYYSAKNNSILADWEAQRQRAASYTQAGTGLANGMLYLYGGMKGGGGGGGGGGKSSFTPQATNTKYGSYSLFG